MHLPGQVFRRNLSVVWPDIEELGVAFTHPLVVDEDTMLDVPSVSVSGKGPGSDWLSSHNRMATVVCKRQAVYQLFMGPCLTHFPAPSETFPQIRLTHRGAEEQLLAVVRARVLY